VILRQPRHRPGFFSFCRCPVSCAPPAPPGRLLLPSPAFRERRHRVLAGSGIAVGRSAVAMVTVGQCPKPPRSYRRGNRTHNSANDDAVGEHVIVVLAPLARWPACGCSFENKASRGAHLSRLSSGSNPAGSRGGLSGLETLQEGHGMPAPPHPQAFSPSQGRSSCTSQTQ